MAPTLRFDLASIQLPYLAALQRLLDLMVISLAGLPLVTEENYQGFGHTEHMMVATAPRLSLGHAQDEARIWHLGNTFRDAIDATGLFLDGVRNVSAVARASNAGQLTVGRLGEITGAEAKGFAELGIAKKVQTLREELGLSLYLYEHVFSVNRARNCLVHRMAIVSTRDTEADGKLRLTFRALELWGHKQDGNLVPVQLGSVVEAGTGIVLRAVDRVREFAVGERILLNTEEVTQVFAMLMQFSITTIEELQKLTAPPSPQNVPAEPASGVP